MYVKSIAYYYFIGRYNTTVEYEQTFRFILILGFAVIVPIGAYHRIKSQATGEKLDRRQEGIFILVTLRPIGIAAMVGLVTYMINTALIAWSSVNWTAELVAMGGCCAWNH